MSSRSFCFFTLFCEGAERIRRRIWLRPLRDSQRAYYYRVLERHFPGLPERYQRQYGPRYECPSPRARELWEAFSRRCGELGLLCCMKDITAACQHGYADRQLSFF